MKNVQGERGPLTLEAARRLAALYQSWGNPPKPSLIKPPSPKPPIIRF